MSFADDSGSPLLDRLQSALDGTSEKAPRPLVDLELPAALKRWAKPEYVAKLRSASVLIPVILRATPTVLFTRRADALRKHAGQISFPGGARDSGDHSAAAAALREAHEEIGLEPQHVSVIGYLGDYPTITGFRITPVIGLVRPPSRFIPSPDEVAEVFEVPLSMVLDPDSYRRKTLLRDGLKLPFYELHFDGTRIWGATAGMLWDLCRKVNHG